MPQSLSRQLATYAESLSYDDLPPRVINKLKALMLHGLVMSMIGGGTAEGKAVIELVVAEEGRPDGATILVDGSRATRMGAAFANSKLMHVTNQSDSYRMLTHPGPHIIPAALATAELEARNGKELLTALAAAYEIGVRIAGDYIPTTQARGFRSSPVYGVFGAAVATGKLLGMTTDQLTTAVALAATFAGGTVEGPRTDGQEMKFHEPNACRNGVMAGLLARQGLRGAEMSLEGDAGFYHAFTGNNRGELSYVFQGATTTDLALVTEGLGDRYELLEVTPKIYPTAGFNNPVIELMAQIRAAHPLEPRDVDRITVEMNWLETLYPSPAFPNPDRARPEVGSTQYFAAYTCVKGQYPLLKESEGASEDHLQIMALMERVSVVGQRDRKPFAPRITVHMADGASYRGEFTGEELKWDFEAETRRVSVILSELPLPNGQANELVTAVEHLEDLETLGELLNLTMYKSERV